MRKLQFIFVVAVGGAIAATPAAASGAASGDSNTDDSRIICKKLLETGSLVRKDKQCFTKAEWDRISESQRRGAANLIHDLATKKGDNN